MVCELCASMDRMRRRGDRLPPRVGDGVVCASCGRPIAAGVGERLLEKVVQLSRFGLTGEPLLARSRTID